MTKTSEATREGGPGVLLGGEPGSLNIITPKKQRLDLQREMSAARNSIRVIHLRALERLGVERGLFCDMAASEFGLGVAFVTAGDEGLYHPGGDELHLILPIVEDGALVDLCAFRSADPTRWLLRSGLGWALGLDRGLERHTWLLDGEAVALAMSPLEWLRQGATGLCVTDWSAPEVTYLRGVPRLVCSTDKLASHLRAALIKPVNIPEILVRESLANAA